MAETLTTTQGSRVLIKGAKDGWETATVIESNASFIVFENDFGKKIQKDVCDLSTFAKPISKEMEEGVDDMAKMSELNESSILCNLNTRYKKDEIYTYIGSILISVNPYKRILELYSDSNLMSYRNIDLGDRPPHVYAIANECFNCMWKREENQCVLISGESGAGKTETTKFMLNYLSRVSQEACKNEVDLNKKSIETSIIESGPILEALGNAKTVYNNNSSRFGKFIQLLFNKSGQIKGAKITDYLLEKHRTVRQNPGERNYHIFYQMLRGLSDEEKDNLYLTAPEDFHYLNQSNCTGDPTLDDVKDWELFDKSLEVIGFKKGQRTDLLSVLAGILHLGNVKFTNAGGAQVVDVDVIEKASRLLGIDGERLEGVMKERTMKLRGEYITSPQSVEQACDSRDSISMSLYSNLFRWIISKINSRIKGPDDFHFIGVLDIFGFENFQVNRFEQFCINFANEKLQEYFNRHIFSLEQIEYSREGIDWCEVEWVDNSECLDLVEKNLGLISLIDEESRFPKGTDASLLNKLHNQHQKNQFYVKPRVTGKEFGIRHYAGEVMYNIEGFLEKNRDTFREDLLALLKDSSCDLIYDIFEKVRSGGDQKGGRGKSKQPTAGGQFKKSLHSLMERLSSANPFFVRCVKPNQKKEKANFDSEVVLNQLRYSGMLETIRVRKAGFPVRRLYKEFWARYWMISSQSQDVEKPEDHCNKILAKIDPDQNMWRFGKTKAFMKEGLETLLEKARSEKLYKIAVIVQSVFKAFYQRKRFLKIKKNNLIIQKHVRGFLAKHRFHKIKKAVLTIQCFQRGRIARKIFQKLLEEKKEIERKRNEAATTIQKYQRGCSARRVFKVLLEKHRQLVALKLQLELERKEKERQEAERIRLEEERLKKEEEKQNQEEDLGLPPPPDVDELSQLPLPSLEITEDKIPLTEITPPSPTDVPIEGYLNNDVEDIQRSSMEIREQSVLDDLDAVINQAETDSTYSSAKSRQSIKSQLLEQERDELEKILQLEREIEEMHRQTEVRAEAATQLQQQAVKETVKDALEVEKSQEDLPDSLKDLGFEDFEKEIESMMNNPPVATSDNSTSGIATISQDQVSNVEVATNDFDSQNGFITDDQLAEYDEESYFTDSTFDDDSDDESEVTGSDQVERWSPDIYFHSYVEVKGGVMNQWKKRWCAISNNLFMIFRSKQDSLKCGWLYKKADSKDGSKMGTIRGTLPRKTWQKKWFTLKSNELSYYDNDEENAKCKGTYNIKQVIDVSDVTEKENGIDIILTNNKILQVAAENTEDTNDWYSFLMKILSSSDHELEAMDSDFANPKNALSTIESSSIKHVSASPVSGKLNVFSITTSQRVYTFSCGMADEMHHWITLLNDSRNAPTIGIQGSGHEYAITQGWLYKTTYNRQKPVHQPRWFVLKPNVIEYYKSADPSSQKLGSFGLNSLCIVGVPDESIYKAKGKWEVSVYGRKHVLHISTDKEEDANVWSSEIQTVIDGLPQIMTKTKQCLGRVKCMKNDKEIDLLYKRNPIMRQTSEPLRSPLLPLPYEQVPTHDGHYTLRDEAVRVFGVLLSMEKETFSDVHQEANALQELLSTCHWSKAFQDEVYLQLIKQTAIYHVSMSTEEQLCDQQHVTSCPHYWHIIACMCCAYYPSRPILSYLKFHLERVQGKYPESDAAIFAEFAIDALQHQSSRRRDYVPSIKEIVAVLELRDLITTVNCYGGATCEISVRPSATAGQVVEKLVRGMQRQQNLNTFALFEHCGGIERAIQPDVYIADVLAKFEKLNQSIRKNAALNNEATPDEWCLYFKLRCVFEPENLTEDSIEYHFIFEDVHEQVIQGLYPSSDDVLRELAALRLQFAVGDYQLQEFEKDLHKYYPVGRVISAYDLNKKLQTAGNGRTKLTSSASAVSLPAIAEGSATISKKRSSSIFNTFRRRGTKKMKDTQSEEAKMMLFKEEMQDIYSNISERWRKCSGLNPIEAVSEYVRLARCWPGYGSYLFKVENNESQFGNSILTLSVAASGVSVYKRGHPTVLENYSYKKILSFGAGASNIFKLQIEQRGEISFLTEEVNEIVKLMRSYVQALYRRNHL